MKVIQSKNLLLVVFTLAQRNNAIISMTNNFFLLNYTLLSFNKFYKYN